MSGSKKLFEDFPPVTTKEWTEKIKADLKGEEFDSKLIWNSPEGLKIMPFYMKEDIVDLPFINTLPGESPWLRGTSAEGNNWLIRQDIVVESYSEANRKALKILEKGVDSLGFVIADPESVTKDSINLLLTGINPEKTEINFASEGKAKEILQSFLSFIECGKYDKAKITGAIEADPLGRLLRNGRLCIPVDAGMDYLSDLTARSIVLPGFRTIHINGPWLADAGADLVKELAFTLAMGNEYLSLLTDRNITPGQAISKIRFSFSTGSNYFFEIARLRAARLLWSVVTDAYKHGDTESAKMKIHCITGKLNDTGNDQYVNLLRTQTRAMSSVLGGADSVTVVPFDKSFRKPDEFSERIARNQLLLLREEAYFGKVADPAGGSWYVEKLTSAIADEAWKLFLKVEEMGGFIAALDKGFISTGIGASGEKDQNK